MNNDEQILRENIQQLIKHVKAKKVNEEKEIRKSLKKLMRLELQHMLSEAATPDVDPHQINQQELTFLKTTKLEKE